MLSYRSVVAIEARLLPPSTTKRSKRMPIFGSTMRFNRRFVDMESNKDLR
jgi:hypothetical protein